MMGVTTLWGVPRGVNVFNRTFGEFFKRVIDVTVLCGRKGEIRNDWISEI